MLHTLVYKWRENCTLNFEMPYCIFLPCQIHHLVFFFVVSDSVLGRKLSDFSFSDETEVSIVCLDNLLQLYMLLLSDHGDALILNVEIWFIKRNTHI